jgi:hypothetical protein
MDGKALANALYEQTETFRFSVDDELYLRTDRLLHYLWQAKLNGLPWHAYVTGLSRVYPIPYSALAQ